MIRYDEKYNNKNEKEEDPSDKKNDLGSQILDLIQASMDSMDFSGLSEGIRNTIDNAGKEAFRQIDEIKNKKNAKNKHWEKKSKYEAHRFDARRRKKGKADNNENLVPVPGRLRKLPGAVAGPLETVIGGFGALGFGATGLGIFLYSLGFAAISGGAILSSLILESVMIPLFLLSGFFLGRGIFKKRRLERLKRYASIWRGESFVMLEKLSNECGQKIGTIRKDVHFILDKNLLEYGRLDEKQTCLMLTREAVDQYETAMSVMESKKKEDQTQSGIDREKTKKCQNDMDTSAGNAGFGERITPENEKDILEEEERKNLASLYNLRDSIGTYEVKVKIDKLHLLISRIFVCTRTYPETSKQAERINQYYLPSIYKLLNVYSDMEKQPIQGENIQKSRKEIEDSLDMMNQALLHMYDELFQGVAMDVTSDVRVLEMMLAKDGWKEDGLHK